MSATSNSAANPASLLAEFPPPTYDQWKALVEAELKGAPFDKKMRTSTWEGITLEPLYRREDAARVPHASNLPGFAPFVRGTRASGYLSRPWQISQEIAVANPASFNDAARAGLNRGLTALNIVLDKATRNGADPDWAKPEEVGAGGLSLASLADLDRALDGIDLEKVPLFIRSGASGMPVGALFIALARKRRSNLACLQGCIEIDPLGVLSHEGRLPQSLQGSYREMAAFTAWSARHAPALQTICVHSRAWHEAGGSAVQELAFALATGLEYLRALDGYGLSVDTVARRIRFAYTIGSRFFVEIAKLRAARLLWSRLISALGGSESAQRASLHVRTSLFNKTVFDPYVNLLRTSVEAFAGVLGSCDSMQVGAFDEVVRPPTDFSQRIARNQQLILREECQLASVIDPAGGSWFVETLTDQLARNAWALFQEIERRGGMARAMTSGWPQREVARMADTRLKAVANRRESVIGTNVYANVSEAPLPDAPADDHHAFHRRRSRQVASARTAAEDEDHQLVLERLGSVVGQAEASLFEACVDAVSVGATLGEITRAVRIKDQPDQSLTPVCLIRAASPFERLRSAVNAHASRKSRRSMVFLANLGPLKQHKARADFARGFFETAGLEVISPVGFKTPEEAASVAIQTGPDAVCICSTDETYPEIVPPLVKALRAVRPDLTVILAGYPEAQIETYKAAGVDDFIHIRADAIEVLRRIVSKMGVTLP